MKSTLYILVLGITLTFIGAYVFSYKVHPAPIVGGDKDKHGCIPSAGYTYSKLKKACIRVFDIGISMSPQSSHLDQTLQAFVVVKSEDENTEAEIFIPYSSDSVILSRIPDNGAGTWGNSSYRLTQWKGMYTLEDRDGTILYQGLSAK